MEDGGWTREHCGVRALRPDPRGAPRPGFMLSVVTRGGSVFSQTARAGRGCPRGPLRMVGGLESSLDCAHLSIWDPSPALKMAPGRLFTRRLRAAGRRRRGAKTGAHAGRPAGPHPHHAVARRAGTARHGLSGEPGGAAAAATTSGFPGPAPGQRWPGALRAAGMRGDGLTRGLQPTKVRGMGREGAYACPPNLGPNEMQAWFATPTRRTLGKCRRHWQIQGKRTIFISN